MNSTDDAYIEERAGVHYVRGSRVPVESLIWQWRDGHTAGAIQEAYSTLRLADVYGALAYYLDHQAAMDQELADGQARYEARRAAAVAADPERYTALCQRMAAARAHQTAS